MKLYGLQKLTLLDYPERIACTVFCGGCNMRCPFCHNAALVLAPGEVDTMSEEDFFAFLEKRRGILDGVCVTGGEPLLQWDLPAFLSRIREMGFSVKLDTNGSFPVRLAEIIEAGNIDYIAMDIKNSREKYAETVGVSDFDVSPILESIRLIRESGIPHEFRTTVVKEFHTPEDIEAIGSMIEGEERYFLQHFKDSGALIEGGLSPMSEEDEDRALNLVRKYVPNAALRGR